MISSLFQYREFRSQCVVWQRVMTLAVLGATWGTHAGNYEVTSTADSGPGSLRQAIVDAGTSADSIVFQIPGPGPHTITPLSPLPLITAGLVDATTQTGYVNQPVIELNGTSAGSGTVGLRLGGAGSTVRGLAINRFSADGIRCDTGGHVIQGNHVGTDVTGSIARGNGQYGIFVFGTSGNRIGGLNAIQRNVVSGTNETGIYILNGSSNIIQGNYVGISADGTNDLGNRNNGITVFNSRDNLIGGTLPGEGNVIAGNNGSGINLNNAGAYGNVIQGNLLGLGYNGAGAVSNTADGITLNNAPRNLIGGTALGAGNIISGNGQAGVFLNGTGAAGNRIEGNHIGTDPTGMTALGNAFAGITMSGALSNVVGGSLLEARNVISGNRQDGVFISAGSAGNVVAGNLIGVNAAGTAALPNSFTGVTLNDSSFNEISGNPDGARSVISGNGNVGIWVNGLNAQSNLIAGNFVGTGVGGTNSLGNTLDGLRITDSAGNQVGGNMPAARNVISGNGFAAGVGAGIYLTGLSATNNTLVGNYIGTDLTGQLAVGNRSEGIYLTSANRTTIGGELPGLGNLISGNTTRGIRLINSSHSLIRGNLMGTTADGVSPLGNGQFNVELEANSNDNQIGGLAEGSGNKMGFTGTFAGGPFAAVRVRDGAINNSILGNAIFSSSAMGIAFTGLSATANDVCDGDSGGNMRQNFPVLIQAYSGANTGVRGALNSQANKTYRVQFFANPACDPSGYGEGQVYLGDVLVTTGADCTSDFVASLPVSVPLGQVITATATDPANNTSEFSACVTVLPLPSLSLTLGDGSQMVLSWTNTATGFVLKVTEDLSPPVSWSTVTNPPVLSNGQLVVTVNRESNRRFFTLSFE
ncbi:MAG: hypothetical protein IH623_02215 [Verrucomicrobia bacterium]|nr:hypothetical protein [Verrucomicrobiota bacterium]